MSSNILPIMLSYQTYEKLGVVQYLLILQELHKQGYQKLRWFSYWAPNGCCLRCHFTMQDNICMRRGELKHCDAQHVWGVSTGQADTKIYDVSSYVDEVKREMQTFLDNCNGSDTAYVAWFNGIVEKAKEGYMPSFGDEYWDALLGQIKMGEEPYPCPPFTEPDLEEQLEILTGRITALRVDAFVNPANTSLLGGGGLDGAIHREAGPELLAECRTLNGCKTGQSKMTDAYKLPCNKIIHTVGPIWSGGSKNEDELLASCYRTALDIAAEQKLTSVAFPCISTGNYHFPKERAAEIAFDVISDYILNGKYKGYVLVCCFLEEDAEIYRRLLKQHKR